MDIKDSYLHGSVGVVKSISVNADKLTYELAAVGVDPIDITLPLATQSTNGLLSKEDKAKLDNMIATQVANNLTLKINSGDVENTSLYTYNGSDAKTLDIKNGSGIGFTNDVESLQIYNTGVRSIATGNSNGTISVNTNGTTADVAVKGLGSAAYTSSDNYVKWRGTEYYNISLRSRIEGGHVRMHYTNIDNESVFGYGYNGTSELVYITNYKKGYGLILGDSLTYRSNVIAYTTSDITGNAATATHASTADKLKTSRKLWGLDFDGSADVSGDMTGVGNITISATGNKDYFINFLYNSTPAYSWRLGYLGSGYADANYFVIDSSRSSGGTWHRALQIGNETLDATFTGIVTAPTFKGNLDGTYVNALTGYTKATSSSAIASTDSLNTALGKLEYKAHYAYNWVTTVTATDTDEYINKWDEIVGFLDSVKEGTDILDEFVTITTDLTIVGSKTFSQPIKVTSTSTTSGVTLRLTSASNYNCITFGLTKSDNTAVHSYLIHRGDSDFRIANNGWTKEYNILHSGNTYISNGTITINGTNITPLTSHQNLDNYVTLNGEQTITGSKTFTAAANTFSGTSAGILTVDRNSTNPAWIKFCKNGTLQGYLGIDNYFLPVFLSGESGSSNKVLIHAGNYTDYTVKKDGTGASGTWRISISGNAATVTCSASISNYDRPIVVTNELNGLYYTTKATLNYSTGNITAPTFTGNLNGSLIVNSINSESEITSGGVRAYSGSGANWTGSVTSMQYAAILSFGNPNRGWQLWCKRGSDHIYYRNGLEDSSGWNTERIILDSANYSSYLGYIGTTAVQASSAELSLTGIRSITSNGVLNLKSTNGNIYLRYNSDDTKTICLTSSAFAPISTSSTKISLGSTTNVWGGVYSTVGNFAGNVTSTGFLKSGSSDSYVLLGGGGHKAITTTVTSESGSLITSGGVYTKLASYLPRLRMTNPDPGHHNTGAIPFILALKAAGTPLYNDPEFSNTEMTGNVHVYNNQSNGAVTITNIADDQFSANSSGRILKISTSAEAARPGRGGFVQSMNSAEGKIFCQIFRAKIPIGFKVISAENSMGKNYKTYWMTDVAGTGKWEWYCRITLCGTEKALNSQGQLVNFGEGGHVYITDGIENSTAAVTWYLSYCNTFELSNGAYDGLRTKYSDNADSVDGQHFNWSNNKNDHTYLWATSSNGQSYLVNRTSISVNHANSSTAVIGSAAITNADRHVWFSDSATETKRAYDDDFTYNPSTNTLTIGGLNVLHSGNSYIKNGIVTINGTSITPLTAHLDLSNYVTLDTDLTITGLKTFESNSSTTGVSLILKNKEWASSMSTAMDFYNGGQYKVPNARIETKMVSNGKAGGTLIFYTLLAHAETNPNPNGLTERFRIGDNGTSKITGDFTVTGSLTINKNEFGSLVIYRNGSKDSVSIQFKNGSNVSLGYIGMNTANKYLYRFSDDSLSSYTIWDSGNDGSGSGLDADLLDGLHDYDYFLRSASSDLAYGDVLFHSLYNERFDCKVETTKTKASLITDTTRYSTSGWTEVTDLTDKLNHLKVFNRDRLSGIELSSTKYGIRYTLTMKNYNSGKFLHILKDYSSTGANWIVICEFLKVNASGTIENTLEVCNQVITWDNEQTYIKLTSVPGDHNRVRITFICADDVTTANSVTLHTISLYNNRGGAQGVISNHGFRYANLDSIIPYENNTWNLGSTDTKWKNVYATMFTGNLTGNVTGNVSGSSGSCTGNATTATKLQTARTLTIGNSAKTFDGSANVNWSLHDILYSETNIGTSTSWDISDPGVYYVAAGSAFTGTNNPEATNGGLTPYRYGLLIVSRAGNGGVAQFYISHNDSSNSYQYGIKFRTGWNSTYLSTWNSLLDSSNYTEYTVKKDGTGASGDWGINITGNAATATSLASTTIISSKSLTLKNTEWTDTGYTFASLITGTYAVQITSGSNLVASGIMSVYKNLADTVGDEIPLHVYGTAAWRPYLRTYNNKLLISSNDVPSANGTGTSRTITIKIARII